MKIKSSFKSRQIIVRLQAGLGNQLYQYATAKALATKLNRKLVIDTKLIAAEAPTRHYDLCFFTIEESYISSFDKWCTRWAASVRLGKLFRTFFPPAWGYKIILDKEEGYDESVFEDHWGPIVLQGYWQSFKYFQNIEDIIREEFQFKTFPSATNRHAIQKIQHTNSVAIHIRRGDYISNPIANKIHGTCDKSYYDRAIQYLYTRLDNPYFFVFTDHPEWAKEYINIEAPTEIIEHNLGLADYEDLRLMSLCKHLIIANSSFSWWGAWLSKTQNNQIVIAPKKWFNIDKVPAEDRIPTEWIRL